MAAPRRIVPGASYLITRRCYQRTFRLRPSPDTTHVLAYCLALALEKTGVVLHAACFMSNHHHVVVTDVRGELPNFLRELHRFSAKALNALQGQWDNLWSAEPCSAVRLADDFDVVDKIAYVAANPVAAGLVPQPDHWPGLSAWRPGVVEIDRPGGYFRTGDCPQLVSLRVDLPHSLGPRAWSSGRWAHQIRDAVATKVAQAHWKMRAAGREFLGRAAVLAQSFAKRANSFEPRRALVPTTAAKDPNARRFLLALQKAFRVAYQLALQAWTAGDRSVIFPAGTWWMRVHHGARCQAEPPAG
jgi:REP element-mobilizing transposase RayT